ncbi:MAG: hypothetical protein JJT87_05170 [Halomonas sp.]|nr:hypothetical protein [Halomonas sp.]MCC5901301.1 hypothetical protein [Halomonas sp.]
MSGQDQAAGLRKWADLQRQQRESASQSVSPTELATDEAATVAGESTLVARDSSDVADVAVAPARVAPKKVIQSLVVVGLPAHQHQVSNVTGRLSQWSALGRQWAGEPDGWDIHLVDPATANLPSLVSRYPRWALWVSSDADAFMYMYRVLRQVHDNNGPKRLLALHEPHLPRQGLLDNLREAAAAYLDTDLLLLAR